MNTRMKKILGGLAVFSTVVVLTACLAPVGNGDNLTNEGEEIPPVPPDTNLTFVVNNVFKNKCGSCHGASPDASNPLSMTTAALARATLFNADSTPRLTYELPGTFPFYRIVPGSPDSSYLYQKVTTASPKSGGRMPLGAPTPLTADQIKIIRRWIEKGASLQ